MNYVVIASADGGATWQPWGDAHSDSIPALIALRAASVQHPERRFEMHCLHPRLYAALSAEKPVVESFF